MGKGLKRDQYLAVFNVRGEITDLSGELVQWVTLDDVDGQRVVSVDGSETSRDCVLVAVSYTRQARREAREGISPQTTRLSFYSFLF